MFAQFMMLILLQALSNGYRIMTKSMWKNFRSRYFLVPACSAVGVRILQLHFNTHLSFAHMIFLESVALLLTPGAIILFLYNNLQQLDWAEEYLILLNNVSIQCRFQDR